MESAEKEAKSIEDQIKPSKETCVVSKHRDKIAPILARGIRSPTISPSHLQASHDKAIEKHHAIFAEKVIRIAMVNNLV